MKKLPTQKIDAIRHSSRIIVRELGFMRNDLADSKLSASAVHSILEIGNGTVSTAREVSTLLKLEKSSVSRLLKGLEKKGLLATESCEQDARQQQLKLTATGWCKFHEIEAFARGNVQAQLSTLPDKTIELVTRGLDAYAVALLQASEQPVPGEVSPSVSISSGYQAGLLGRVAAMHATYYAENYSFGSVFECKVASEMAEFLGRLDNPKNDVFLAVVQREVVGSVSIDGEDLGDGCAHLRWFVVDDSARGLGLGKTLLARALDFVDQNGFDETRLWTFKGLDAARYLYEKMGFVLTEEKPGVQWGKEVREQCFVRK